MNYLSSAQVGAMLGSLIVSTLLALWYYVPWSLRVTRRDALLVLLWLHVPRYVTIFGCVGLLVAVALKPHATASRNE